MIRHLLYYAPSKLIPGIVNFLGLMIYARIFTKEEYGRYAYVLAIVGLVQSICYPWIRLSLIRYYQKYKKNGEGNQYLHYTLYLFIIVSIILALGWGAFLLINDSSPSVKGLLMLGFPLMILSALLEQLMGFVRADLDSKHFAINTISNSILKLSIVLLLVYLFHLNEIAIFLSIIFTNIILISFFLKKKIDISYRLLRPNKTYRNEALVYGIPLTFTFLLTFIINSSDRIIIKHFLDDEAVGLYSLPYELSTFTITNVFMVFNLAFFPVIIREYENFGINKTRERIKQYFSLMLVLVFPVTIFIIFLSPYITGLFLGESYNTEVAINIIKLITIAGFLSGIKAFYFDMAFHLASKTKIQIIPVIISAISNILLNLYLIPFQGVIGAVNATIIAYTLGLITSYFLGKKIIQLPIPLKELIKVTIPSLILLLTLNYMPFSQITWSAFLFKVIIGSVVYILFIFTFNAAGIRETLKRVLTR